jgi:methionyl-tRNA formyltransferase
MGLRVIFMGTPDFAVPALQALLASSHEVIAVYAQPPRPKGRGQQVQKSPVQLCAEEAGVPVFNPLSFKKDPAAVEHFASLKADIAIVAAYGLILPISILTAPKFGCLNIHASLLPRWRGASPIQHSIWYGDAETGVTIMQMDAGLDTGGMIEKAVVPITPTTTTATLHDSLSQLGGGMVTGILDRLEKGEKVTAEPQDEKLTVYAPLLKKEDGRIDWTKDAQAIDCQVRALNPWPGTYTLSPKGARLKVLAGKPVTGNGSAAKILTRDGVVACGRGGYQITSIQPDNARPMDAASAVNGGYLVPGESLA